MSRVGRISGLALSAVLVLGVTACGTSPGAAVTIDGQSFSQTALSAEATTETGYDANDPDAIARANQNVASRYIRRQLLADAAKAQGVTVDQQQLAAAREDQGLAQTAPLIGLPSGDVEDLLLLDELMKKVPAEGIEITDVSVKVDLLTTASRAEAIALRAQLQNDRHADAVASRAQGQTTTWSVLTAPGVGFAGVFLASPGDVLLIPQPAGYAVIRVLSRSSAPGKLTRQLLATAVQSLSTDQPQPDAIWLVLAAQAQRASVEVNPRFGDWDPATVQVVSSPGQS